MGEQQESTKIRLYQIEVNHRVTHQEIQDQKNSLMNYPCKIGMPSMRSWEISQSDPSNLESICLDAIRISGLSLMSVQMIQQDRQDKLTSVCSTSIRVDQPAHD